MSLHFSKKQKTQKIFYFVSLLEVAIMSKFEKVIVENASESSTSDSLEDNPNLFDLNHDPSENRSPIVFKTKTYHVGSGNIIGKNHSRIL